MSQVLQEHIHCYDKRKNYENENYENLFIFAVTPSLSGRGSLLQPPHSPTFSTVKIFEHFFHRYIDRMAILAKTQKWYEGKSEKGGGGLQQPSLLRERVKLRACILYFAKIV